MNKIIFALPLLLSACGAIEPSFATDRPKDPHMGYVYRDKHVIAVRGPFWDRADCEWSAGAIYEAAQVQIHRPYQTSPEQALSLMTTEMKCVRIENGKDVQILWP